MSALSVPLTIFSQPIFNLLLFLLLGLACLPAETPWLQLGLKGFSLPEPSRTFMIRNAVVQAVWFFFVAHIPAHLSKKMFFVDIAWPGGLALMSALAFLQMLQESAPARAADLALVGIFALHGVSLSGTSLTCERTSTHAKRTSSASGAHVPWRMWSLL